MLHRLACVMSRQLGFLNAASVISSGCMERVFDGPPLFAAPGDGPATRAAPLQETDRVATGDADQRADQLPSADSASECKHLLIVFEGSAVSALM